MGEVDAQPSREETPSVDWDFGHFQTVNSTAFEAETSERTMKHEQHNTPVPAAPGIDRRTVAKSIAWTIPIIATAVAVPSASASGSSKTWDLSPEFIGAQGFDETQGSRHVVGREFPSVLRLRSLDPSGGAVPVGSQVIFTFDVTVVTARVPSAATMPAGLSRSALVDEDSGLINGYIFTFTQSLPSGAHIDIPITVAPGAGRGELGSREGTLSATGLTSSDSDPSNNIASRVGYAVVTAV